MKGKKVELGGESLFSKLSFIKNKQRAALSEEHTKQLLLIATAERTPDFSKLVESMQSQGSH